MGVLGCCCCCCCDESEADVEVAVIDVDVDGEVDVTVDVGGVANVASKLNARLDIVVAVICCAANVDAVVSVDAGAVVCMICVDACVKKCPRRALGLRPSHHHPGLGPPNSLTPFYAS